MSKDLNRNAITPAKTVGTSHTNITAQCAGCGTPETIPATNIINISDKKKDKGEKITGESHTGTAACRKMTQSEETLASAETCPAGIPREHSLPTETVSLRGTHAQHFLILPTTIPASRTGQPLPAHRRAAGDRIPHPLRPRRPGGAQKKSPGDGYHKPAPGNQ